MKLLTSTAHTNGRDGEKHHNSFTGSVQFSHSLTSQDNGFRLMGLVYYTPLILFQPYKVISPLDIYTYKDNYRKAYLHLP